jgi:nucleoside-diphosphate-sugar epimerase
VEDSPLWPSRVDAAEADPDIAAQSVPAQYGILKAGCELAAGTAPLGALIFRPGVILGPGEYTGRMLSLFERAQRGGRWLLGGSPSDQIQPVDVRDVSRFVLNRIAIHDEGAYNVVAPREPERNYGALIDACLEVTGGTAELLWGEAEWLLEQGVREWTEIPLWRTPRGTWAVSGQKAADAGLHCRPLRETVADTWDDFQEHPPVPHPRQAEHGMDPAREAELLERYDLFRAR